MDRKSFTTDDGATLSYLEGGQGHPLIMIPGWSQSADEFKRQFDTLCDGAHVFAFDMRGHGESVSVLHGYRIYRLATDIHEFIHHRDISGADMLGHSMGCSIIWAFLDLFGHAHPPRKLVLVDQAPCVTAKPGWSDAEHLKYGVLLPTYEAMADFIIAVQSTSDINGLKELLRGMFSASMDENDLTWIASENLKLPRTHAADLLYDHVLIDWRDVISRINRPTFVIGGEKSIFSAESQRWIADQIPNAKVSIFPENDGGSHFMFFENPDRFNTEVAAFLKTTE